MGEKGFYLVWSERTGRTTFKHQSKGSAIREAERLSRKNPGDEFHVLAPVSKCRVSDIAWTEFEFDDDIPF